MGILLKLALDLPRDEGRGESSLRGKIERSACRAVREGIGMDGKTEKVGGVTRDGSMRGCSPGDGSVRAFSAVGVGEMSRLIMDAASDLALTESLGVGTSSPVFSISPGNCNLGRQDCGLLAPLGVVGLLK